MDWIIGLQKAVDYYISPRIAKSAPRCYSERSGRQVTANLGNIVRGERRWKYWSFWEFS